MSVLDSRFFGRFAGARGCGVGALAGGLLTASRPAAYPTWSSESDAPLLSAVTHARDARLDSRAAPKPSLVPTARANGSRHVPEKATRVPKSSRAPTVDIAATADPRRSSNGAEEEQTDQALEGRRLRRAARRADAGRARSVRGGGSEQARRERPLPTGAGEQRVQGLRVQVGGRRVHEILRHRRSG